MSLVKSTIQRLTGTIESQRFDHPTWIQVTYSEESKYHGIQSGVKAAAYRLKSDELVVRKATTHMNESPYRRWSLDEIEVAWVGGISRPRYEHRLIVGDFAVVADNGGSG